MASRPGDSVTAPWALSARGTRQVEGDQRADQRPAGQHRHRRRRAVLAGVDERRAGGGRAEQREEEHRRCRDQGAVAGQDRPDDQADGPEDEQQAQPRVDAKRHRAVRQRPADQDRKSTRLNSSHVEISYAVFCLKKKKKKYNTSFFKKKKKTKQI